MITGNELKSHLRNNIKSLYPITLLIIFNVVLLNTCSLLGCYEVNLSNIFRMNLLCNACTDISYHIQVHQVKIYLFFGGYCLKKANSFIDQQIKNVSPVKSWD